MTNQASKTLVLGIGNLLWADEGFGVRCVEEMARRYAVGDDVAFLDGGTQGLYLVHFVTAASRMIVFDAIDYGLEPGTLRIIEGDDVPCFMGAKKMSLHQTGFQEVLAAARLLGHYPDELILIGVQPVELDDFGGSLRDVVKARIDEAIAIAVARLKKWGCEIAPRPGPQVSASSDALSLDRYESERPDERAACRFGDTRFMHNVEGAD